MTSLLAPGAKLPSYGLVRPKNQPTALWGGKAGATLGAQGWKGVGGGWWTPPAGYKAPVAPKPTYSGTTATTPPTPTVQSPSPFDSTYFTNVTSNAAKIAAQIAGYQRQQAQAGTNYDVAMQGFATQQPRDELAARIAANRRGGIDSSALGSQLGQIGVGYNAKRANALSTKTAALQSLADQISQAQAGQDVYNAGQYEQAVERASTAAQKNPALGMSTIPPVNQRYLIKGGAAAPSYVLTPPKGAPSSARWSSTKPTTGKWRGIGAGWWVPA
jgi:hypothetical protein